MNIGNIQLKNFIELDECEKKTILQWRNNNDIKKWMYTSKVISLKEHEQFIEKLKNNNKNQYFLVLKENEKLGVICFTGIERDKTFFGLYSNPDLIMPGIGRVLESVSIDYAFDTLKVKILKLEVYTENNKAINLHKKYNFLETHKKQVGNKEVLCMELKSENR